MTPQEFGDMLFKLRKDRKLSQEALGTLVGRKGGTISSWERGEKSPPAEVIRRLAQVLKVDVRELMGEKQPAVPLEGMGLIRRREVLWEKAEERLREIYGENPPLPVLNRFCKEKNVLVFTNEVILFDITREILRDAERKGKEARGTGTWQGCFLAWLMGASPVNPLPPHYLCPKCGRMEFHGEELSGWDLPEKRCECGEAMIRDGQGLPYEVSMIGSGGRFRTVEIELPMSLWEDAQKTILRMAGPYFSLRKHEEDTKGGLYIPVTSFFLEAKKKEKSPDYIEDIERVEELRNGTTPVSRAAFRLVPLPDRKRTGRKPRERKPTLNGLLREEVLFRTLERHNEAKEEEKEYTGMDFTLEDPGKYREGLTFGKLTGLFSAMQNSYMEDTPEKTAEAVGLSLAEMPVSWEDLWKLILRSNPGRDVSGIAGQIVLNCRNGYYVNSLTDADRALFRELNLPDWFPEYAKRIIALDFRCRAAADVYRQVTETWQRMEVEKNA